MKHYIYIFLLFFSFFLKGQNFDFIDIPFDKGGQNLLFPGTGGIKNPMFSNIDLNGDGIKDLFIFDKEGFTILTFLHTGAQDEISYVFAPEYVPFFPKLNTFALLVDYNDDGVEDIFTGGVIPSTIEVFKGKRVADQLKFEQVTFGFPGSIGNFLQVFVGGYTQIYNSSIDIPAITDLDNDGDIDILSFQSASDKLTFYENRAADENLPADSLKFVLNTACWGGFQENEFSSDIFLSTSPDDCYNLHLPDKGEIRHSGSTCLFLDMDADGDKDLLLGDLTNTQLKLLINRGTSKKGWVNEIDHNFPSNDVPVNIQVFLAAYHVDVNNDGKRDLIISPNDRSDSERTNHIWLYLNKGTDVNPTFELFTKSFLTDQTVTLGSGSHPCFIDFNQDGLMDLLIGGNGSIEYDGSRKTWMELYQNTGSREEPHFSLVNSDYLEFTKIVNPYVRLAPHAGDLDGDGDTDLLVGEFTGRMFYFKNNAGAGNPVSFDPRVYPFANIFPGFAIKPFITDFNKDGLNDIVIGELNNELNYFQNTGSLLNPSFVSSVNNPPNSKNLGNIFSQQNDYFSESGAPFFFEDKTGAKMLFGNQGGPVKLYEVTDNRPETTFTLSNSQLGDIFVGTRTVPALYDIDNDGYFEMVIGNERGGICFFNTTFQKNNVAADNFESIKPGFVYPNPNYGDFYSTYDPDAEITVFDLFGNQINLEKRENSFSIQNRQQGEYLIQIKQNRQYYYEKIVLIK